MPSQSQLPPSTATREKENFCCTKLSSYGFSAHASSGHPRSYLHRRQSHCTVRTEIQERAGLAYDVDGQLKPESRPPSKLSGGCYAAPDVVYIEEVTWTLAPTLAMDCPCSSPSRGFFLLREPAFEPSAIQVFLDEITSARDKQ